MVDTIPVDTMRFTWSAIRTFEFDKPGLRGYDAPVSEFWHLTGTGDNPQRRGAPFDRFGNPERYAFEKVQVTQVWAEGRALVTPGWAVKAEAIGALPLRKDGTRAVGRHWATVLLDGPGMWGSRTLDDWIMPDEVRAWIEAHLHPTSTLRMVEEE